MICSFYYLEFKVKPMSNNQILCTMATMENSGIKRKNQDLFGEIQPMHIDSSTKDKASVNTDDALLMHGTELENEAHAATTTIRTAINPISQSSADIAHSTENI